VETGALVKLWFDVEMDGGNDYCSWSHDPGSTLVLLSSLWRRRRSVSSRWPVTSASRVHYKSKKRNIASEQIPGRSRRSVGVGVGVGVGATCHSRPMLLLPPTSEVQTPDRPTSQAPAGQARPGGMMRMAMAIHIRQLQLQTANQQTAPGRRSGPAAPSRPQHCTTHNKFCFYGGSGEAQHRLAPCRGTWKTEDRV
jgi:hypothetical protein